MEIKHNALMNIIQFASTENEQLLVSFANDKEEVGINQHIQGLYQAALAAQDIGENEAVLVQLLAFTHYHFLFSHICMMRCHLSEAFGSARIALDAALIAAVIIKDRGKQVEYATRKYPFDGQLNRYLGNLIKDKKPLPHRLVPTILQLNKTFSTFANHADIGSFIHRVDIKKPAADQINYFIHYFQYAKNEDEKKLHNMLLFQVYVYILDVFSDFLVIEQKMLPAMWSEQVRELGRKIEQRMTGLKNKVSVPEADDDEPEMDVPSPDTTEHSMPK